MNSADCLQVMVVPTGIRDGDNLSWRHLGEQAKWKNVTIS